MIFNMITGDGSGFEFLDKIPDRPQVIVTTAFSEHAYKGFEQGITDLLLKPFSAERFDMAIQKALITITEIQSTDGPSRPVKATPVIVVRSGRRSVYIPIPAIRSVEAVGNNVRLHLDGREWRGSATDTTA